MDKRVDIENSNIETEIYDLVVVGAGISGAHLSQAAVNASKKVCIVDKARGSGGRLSTKRVEVKKEILNLSVPEKQNQLNNTVVGFDLGCSDFDFTNPELHSVGLSWLDSNIVSSQNGSTLNPLHRSSYLTRTLIKDVETKFSSRISRIEREGGCWNCFVNAGDNEQRLLATQTLVLAMPAPQVSDLIPPSPYKLPLKTVLYNPQWVVMVALPEEIELDAIEDEIFFNGDIARIVCESEKPERLLIEGLKIWVIQFSPQWSYNHLDWTKEMVQDHVRETLSTIVKVGSVYAHRWLYSRVQTGLHTSNGILKLDENLYAMGDWLLKKGQAKDSGGVEAALLSAERLISELDYDRTIES